jgi:DNA modification methylase
LAPRAEDLPALELAFEELRRAALDTRPISGLTHRFYRYPARFSPTFAAAAISQFSKPGALILDPYMGGATTVVEALRLGRRAIGCDLNSLAVFIARVKTSPLNETERQALKTWADEVVPSLSYKHTPSGLLKVTCARRTRNLTLPGARPLKKVMALALLTLDDLLPTRNARNFARCALLNVGQWALNGRTRPTAAREFRAKLTMTLREMLEGLAEFERELQRYGKNPDLHLLNDSAENIHLHNVFTSAKADCAISSPPYPGIHMLYHRWQVNGRRESPAPYWLADCQDGQGAAFYNFADRREQAIDAYFASSLKTLKSIRRVMNNGAPFIQMIAFSDPVRHLTRYMENMRLAGFEDMLPAGYRKIQRQVPGRRWHATIKGKLNSAREIVLVHRAC